MCTYVYIYIYMYYHMHIIWFLLHIYIYTCFLFLILHFQRVQIRTPSFVSTPEFAGHCRCASWGKSMPGERQMSFQLEKSWLIIIDAVFYNGSFQFFIGKMIDHWFLGFQWVPSVEMPPYDSKNNSFARTLLVEELVKGMRFLWFQPPYHLTPVSYDALMCPFGGVLEWGYPRIIHLYVDFPLQTIHLGYPPFMETPISSF